MSRNYRQEYLRYHARPEQRRRRSSRNKARRKAMSIYGPRAMAGKDVDHRDRNAMNNGRHNLRLQDRSKNRSRNK